MRQHPRQPEPSPHPGLGALGWSEERRTLQGRRAVGVLAGPPSQGRGLTRRAGAGPSRWLAVLLIGAFVMAACATATASAAKKLPAGRGPVTITMFGGQPGTVINVKTNWFTKYAEQRFHLNFKFNLVPDGDVGTKQPLLLASGDYPAVIWDGSITQENALQYGGNGVFRPLNGLIKKYAPNVWHVIQTAPGYKQDVTAPNGKIYSLTTYNYCYHCYFVFAYYINLKYLDEYHLPMPRTTAEFTHTLEVFKAHGLVPLTGASDSQGGYGSDIIVYLMNAFIPLNVDLGSTTSAYIDVAHGKLLFAPGQPQWRAGLEYIHMLYSKGLFPKSDLTQQAIAMESLVGQEKAGVFAGGGPNAGIPNYGAPNSHYLDWLAMPALRGPNGVQSAAFSGGVSGLQFAITNHASKAQEIGIMKLLNFMYTAKGAQMEDFGPSGKYWVPARKGVDGLVPKQALFNTNWNAFYSTNSEQNAGWNQWGPIDQGEAWRNLAYSDPPFTSNGAQSNMQLVTGVDYAGHQAPEAYPPAVWVPTSEAQTYATEQTNIDNYVTQWTYEFVTGAKSLSSQWNHYVAGLRSLGLSNYMKVSKQAMGHPEKTTIPEYEPSPSDIKYLVCAGPVTPLIQKYLVESGVPAADFTCTK